MYISTLRLTNVRTFVETEFRFVHPDQPFAARGTRPQNPDDPLPRPRLPNVNLLLGDNGSGKTTVLRSIGLAALGPAVDSAGLRDPGLIRRAAGPSKPTEAELHAEFALHPQDNAEPGVIGVSHVRATRRGDIEELKAFREGGHEPEPLWNPVFEEKNDAFFAVGYGATRRVESAERFDMGARTSTRFARAQRLAGLFEDSFSLIPLTYWLPNLKSANRGRYVQVVHLLNRLLGPGNYTFTEKLERGEYLFERGGTTAPFRALSDGYRAFIGWVGDLLYHVCYGAPSGKKLVESSGIVLVDEIDLHLHPRWQMKVIPTLAKALPRMQFVLTSHSPLVAGSLEWMNILTLKTADKTNATRVRRLAQSIHGLDSDQILLSDFFGLKSSRAGAKKTQLDALTEKARTGDDDAALEIVKQLSRGLEDAP